MSTVERPAEPMTPEAPSRNPQTEAGRELMAFAEIREGAGVWGVTRLDILAIEAEAAQRVVERISDAIEDGDPSGIVARLYRILDEVRTGITVDTAIPPADWEPDDELAGLPIGDSAGEEEGQK